MRMPQSLTGNETVEVVIVGAGPAGSTMATHLASRGHDVLLLDAQPFPRWAVGESLTPKILKPLERNGVRRLVEEAGFNRMTGHTHLWETPELIETDFDNGVGFQVDRAIFDQILSDHAVESGARFMSGITVLRTTVIEGRVNGVEWRNADGKTGRLAARLVVDATGGVGVLARQHELRYPLDWPTTVAVVGYLSGDDDVGTRTLVEAFDDGWIWSFILADGRRGIALFVDPADSKRMAGANIAQNWLHRLEAAQSLRNYLREAEIVVAPACFDVSWYSSHTRGKTGLLIIGDAADFVDPISSQGVFRAMDGAHRAAIAADEILNHEGKTDAAIRWYDRMEDRSSSAYAEQMRQSYEVAGSWQKSAFFAGRLGRHPRIEGVPLPSEETAARDHLKELGRRGLIPAAVFRPTGALVCGEELTISDGGLTAEEHVRCEGGSLTAAVPAALTDVNWLEALREGSTVRELVRRLSLDSSESREEFMEFLVEMSEIGHLKVEVPE